MCVWIWAPWNSSRHIKFFHLWSAGKIQQNLFLQLFDPRGDMSVQGSSVSQGMLWWNAQSALVSTNASMQASPSPHPLGLDKPRFPGYEINRMQWHQKLSTEIPGRHGDPRHEIVMWFTIHKINTNHHSNWIGQSWVHEWQISCLIWVEFST